MNKCEGCGGYVSRSFARVFGDEDDTVHRCLNCVDREIGGRSAIFQGGAAIKSREEVIERMSRSSNEAAEV